MPNIPLRQIEPNPQQPRRDFPDEHIQKLAASIKERGLLQAIVVRKIADKRYQIVAGECRWRAHKLLKARTIRAEVVAIDDKVTLLAAIVENLQRKDMNAIEEGNAYKALIAIGYTQAEIVKELSLKSPGIITQRLALLNLTPEIQTLVICGQLPVSMAFGVAQVSPDRQAAMMRSIASGKLKSVEQVRAAGFAIREAEAQLDVFGGASKQSEHDVATLTMLEHKIEAIAQMVAAGFKEGECVAAKRVNPDRVQVMCAKLVLIRKHIRQMERDLAGAMAQNEMFLEGEADGNSDPKH